MQTSSSTSQAQGSLSRSDRLLYDIWYHRRTLFHHRTSDEPIISRGRPSSEESAKEGLRKAQIDLMEIAVCTCFGISRLRDLFPPFPDQPRSEKGFRYPVLVPSTSLRFPQWCDVFGVQALNDETRTALIKVSEAIEVTKDLRWQFVHRGVEYGSAITVARAYAESVLENTRPVTPVEAALLPFYFGQRFSPSRLLCFQNGHHFLLEKGKLSLVFPETEVAFCLCPVVLVS